MTESFTRTFRLSESQARSSGFTQEIDMGFTHRSVKRGFLSAVLSGGLGIVLIGGCSGQPATGTHVGESAELVQKRTESIKSAMQRGAYGIRYKAKAAQ
jgi:hypothetical protein